MITITIQPFDGFNERTNQFIELKEPLVLKLENSLHAIAEWEKKFKKKYFPDRKKTPNPYEKEKENEPRFSQEESIYFIKCMVINIPFEDIKDEYLYGLSVEDAKTINEYISDSQSALKSIPSVDDPKAPKDAVALTSERIYAWMFESQIPLELEYWNINRLMNVIQIINWDNTPSDKKKKRKMHDVARDMALENERRLKQYGTKG